MYVYFINDITLISPLHIRDAHRGVEKYAKVLFYALTYSLCDIIILTLNLPES